MQIYLLKIPTLDDFLDNLERMKVFIHESQHSIFDVKNKGQVASALAKVVVQYLAEKEFGQKALLFSSTANGKPFIESLPDFCFNISHSKDFIAIAIDRKAVGIDVETLRDYKPLVAKRFFHENEYCFLEYLSHEKQDVFFTQIWTLKESYVKFTGLGIANNFSNFSIILDSDEVKIEGKKHLSVYFRHYVLSDSVFVSVCATSSSFPSEVIELSFPSLIIDGDF